MDLLSTACTAERREKSHYKDARRQQTISCGWMGGCGRRGCTTRTKPLSVTLFYLLIQWKHEQWNTQLFQTSLRLLCSWFRWFQSIKSSARVYDLRFKVNGRISHRRGLFIWRWALGNVLVLVMVQPQTRSAVSGQNKGMRRIYSKNTWVLSLVSAVCIQTKIHPVRLSYQSSRSQRSEDEGNSLQPLYFSWSTFCILPADFCKP